MSNLHNPVTLPRQSSVLVNHSNCYGGILEQLIWNWIVYSPWALLPVEARFGLAEYFFGYVDRDRLLFHSNYAALLCEKTARLTL